MRIKGSTARAIYKKYETTKDIFERKEEQKRRLLIEELSKKVEEERKNQARKMPE